MQKAEMVVSIVNLGYEEKVVEIARLAGATGGTIINANGTGKIDSEKFFGIAINPEKVIILFIVKATKKEQLLKALYNDVGLQSEAQGISFAIPVDDMTDNLKEQLFGKQEPEQ